MADYNLGTARGKIQVDYDGKGVKSAKEDLGQLQKSAHRSGESMSEAGNRIGIAGAGIAAGVGLAAKVAIDFEKEISAIGAVSGASSADLEALRKKALQLGADTSFSASQAALAMEELAKAGLPVEDILNGAADATVSLAAAGGVELPAAAELAADAMATFSLKAKDMPKIADLIAGAANASTISVGDFGQSLKQAGAVANLVGLSFKDTAVAIALMGKAGIKGSDAGTSLKTMLSNLQPTTLKQKELFKELGLITKQGGNAFFDARGNIKSLADISGLLQEKTKNMTSAQKQMTLETIFGSDAIRAAAVLTKAGSKGFEDMAGAMGKVTAQEVAAKRLDNTAGALEQLKGSAETAAISLGTILLPFITKLAKALTKAANWFAGLNSGTKSTIVNVALVTAGILLLVATIAKIIALANAIKVVVLAIKAWALWSKIVAVATKAWAAVQWLLNVAMAANPIGLIIIAIIALIAGIVLLWKHSETFRKIVLAVWNAIKVAAKAVADWFMDKIVPSLKQAWEQLKVVFEVGKKVVMLVLNGIIAQFKFWWNALRFVFITFVNGAKLYWSWISSIFKAAINVVVGIFKFFVADITARINAIKTIVSRVAGFFTSMRDAVISRVTSLVSFVKSLPGRIASALGNLGSLLWNKGRELVQGLINGLQSMLGRLRDAAAAMLGPLGRFLPGSPAKEGPLSGRGYVKLRGQRMVEDFSAGILSSAAQARDAVEKVMSNAALNMPIDASAQVGAAQIGAAPLNVNPVVLPSGNNAPTRTITIENLNVQGVWDLSKPVPRTLVSNLHLALDRYEREHR